MKVLVLHGLKKPFSEDPRKRQNTWVHQLANDFGGEPFMWSGTLSGMPSAIRALAVRIKATRPKVIIAKSIGALIAHRAIVAAGVPVDLLVRVGPPCNRSRLPRAQLISKVHDINAYGDWVQRYWGWLGRLVYPIETGVNPIEKLFFKGVNHHELGQRPGFYFALNLEGQ